MIYRALNPLPMLLLSCTLGLAQSGGDNEVYIERYQHLAIEEMERTGVPASIKMAQALLESGAGSSDLALIANNHFGIKCGGSWSGKTYKKHDDEFTSLGLPKKSCFRHYNSVEESFRAHSDFLRGNRRYHQLFSYDVTDYRRWAKGLKDAGYATSPQYHKKLIDLIERYDLGRLDRMTAGIPIIVGADPENRPERPSPPAGGARSDLPSVAVPDATPGARPAELTYYNDVRCIIARRQNTVGELATLMNVALQDILRYNENLTTADQVVEPGLRVYTQPKRRHYRGREKWHQVATGETMLDISVRYGISLPHLYQRNRLFPGNEPAPGSRIKIRGGKVSAPPALSSDDHDRLEVKARHTREETPRLDFEIEGSQGTTPPPSGSGRLEWDEAPQGERRPEPRAAIIDTRNTKSSPAPIVDATSGPAPSGAAAAPAYHQVASGETLWSIARRYGTTVNRLQALNGLAPGAVLYSGMKLQVD